MPTCFSRIAITRRGRLLAAAARRRATTVVLGTTKFSIGAHRHRTIRFRLTAAGLTYLHAHSSATAVTLVTIVRAGKGKPVTLTKYVPLKLRAPAHRGK